MTDHDQRIAKFVKRAKFISHQSHLDKIIASFPESHRQIAIDAVSGILPEKLTVPTKNAEVNAKRKRLVNKSTTGAAVPRNSRR